MSVCSVCLICLSALSAWIACSKPAAGTNELETFVNFRDTVTNGSANPGCKVQAKAKSNEEWKKLGKS